MHLLLVVMSFALAGLWIWLGVRVFNCRERWAKWTLAVSVGLPVLYAASFWPACWLSSRESLAPATIERVYAPLWFLADDDLIPKPIRRAVWWYATIDQCDMFWARRRARVTLKIWVAAPLSSPVDSDAGEQGSGSDVKD